MSQIGSFPQKTRGENSPKKWGLKPSGISVFSSLHLPFPNCHPLSWWRTPWYDPRSNPPKNRIAVFQGSSQFTNMANAGKSPFFNRRLEIQMHLHSKCCYFPATVTIHHVSLPGGGVVSTLFFPAVYQQKKLLQGVPQADAWDFWSPWWWSTTLHETNSSHLKGWHCNGKVAFQSSGGLLLLTHWDDHPSALPEIQGLPW